MQPVVMAPNNLSTKHYGLNKIKEKDTGSDVSDHDGVKASWHCLPCAASFPIIGN